MADQDAGNVYVEYVSYGSSGWPRRLVNGLARQSGLAFVIASVAALVLLSGVALWSANDLRRSNATMDRTSSSAAIASDAHSRTIQPYRFAALEAGESRFRAARVGQMNAAGVMSPVDLDLIADRQRRAILFGLPAIFDRGSDPAVANGLRRAITDESQPTRMTPQIALAAPSLVSGHAGLVRPAFVCVTCDSSDRLADYRSVVQSGEAKSASDHLRIARAATDFEEFETARSHLDRATQLLRQNLETPEVSNRIYAQIGQTFVLMGETEKGEKLIRDAKSFWRLDKSKDRVGGLHQLLLWEAQFAAFNQDVQQAEDTLEKFATVVSGYPISPAQASRWIEDAYASCLVLCEQPSEFAVPAEWRTFDAELGWCKPSAVFAKHKGKRLPSGLHWRDNPGT